MTDKKVENRFFDGMVEIACATFKIMHEGLKTKFYEKWDDLLTIGSVAFILSVWIRHAEFQAFLRPRGYHTIVSILDHVFVPMSYPRILLFTTILVTLGFTFFYGIRPYFKFRAYQIGLDHLNLKSGLDHRPKLLQVFEIDDNRTRLLVKSTGLGEERYKSRLDDLRASVGERIESVRFFDKNSTCVEIFLAKKLLQSKLLYSEVESHLQRPFSFIVGKSQSGLIMESLEDVPHYMIAGSTGGGKSVAFKSMLMGLLESSKQLQMFLFDFKRVEMTDFSVLPNVRVVNDELEAQIILSHLEKEMERRFKFLEEKGFKSIDPARDKMNRIVVGIDECTDLTSKVPKNNSNYAVVESARASLDNLSRKARACGIHLILATQKIDKGSVDTRVQENIEGRLALRMNTMENSVRVLQNAMAYHLPSIPGRAIWKKGANYSEVQCPFLTDVEIKSKLEVLKASKKFEHVKSEEKSDFNEEIDTETNILVKRRGGLQKN
jgi:hypothetical protein